LCGRVTKGGKKETSRTREKGKKKRKDRVRTDLLLLLEGGRRRGLSTSEREGGGGGKERGAVPYEISMVDSMEGRVIPTIAKGGELRRENSLHLDGREEKTPHLFCFDQEKRKTPNSVWKFFVKYA